MNEHVTVAAPRRALLGAALVAAAGGVLLPRAARADDAADIAAAVEAFRVGLKEGNRAGLEAVIAPELNYGHSSARVENRQQFLDNATSGAAPFRSLDLSDQTVRVTGDTAVVRHRFTAEQDTGGRTVNVRIGVLQVWQKRSGRWLLLARQAYALPA